MLLTQGIAPNIKDKDGKTALHDAAILNKPSMMKSLLNANLNIEASDNVDMTPLHYAALYARPEIISILAQHGAQIDAINKFSHTPLLSLTTIHNNSIITFIREYYKEVQEAKAVKVLVDNGANINATDLERNTSLHWAAIHGIPEVIEELIKLGASINARNTDGNTPLHTAVLQKSTKTVDILLNSGADTTIKNRIGYTPLTLCTLEENYVRPKVTNNNIQEIFNEKNLVSRSGKIQYEMSSLHERKNFSYYSNVEHDGNRHRSASILVPGVKMKLFDPGSALLYDANKITINMYIKQGEFTASTGLGAEKYNRENFHNIIAYNSERLDTLYKEKFISEFQKVWKNQILKNPDFSNMEDNEVMANLFPEALLGISIQKGPHQKINALADKYYVSEKYGYDLPIVIVADGKLEVWNPKLNEIKELISLNKEEQSNIAELGFTLDKNGEIGILNKNEVTAKEVKEFFNQQNNGDKKNTPLYMNKLLELVNDRLKNDNLPIIDKLDDFIIHKEDIKNFIHEIDKKISSKDLEELSNEVVKSMQSHRPSKYSFPELADYKSVKEILEKYQPAKTPQQIAEQMNIDLKTIEKIKEIFNKALPLVEKKYVKPVSRNIGR